MQTLLARGESMALHLLGGDRSLPWELAEHRRRGHHRVRGNDSSVAYRFPVTGIGVEADIGRAAREAAGELDLVAATLKTASFATAHRYIALLRRAAGLDQPAGPGAPAVSDA